jgi:hypothetical protein
MPSRLFPDAISLRTGRAFLKETFMTRNAKAVLNLTLKELFQPEFVREVLDRKLADGVRKPKASLLRSKTVTTHVRKRVFETFDTGKANPRLSDLIKFTPAELQSMADLGPKMLNWLEEYLHLLGVVLPHTSSVHGMSNAAQKVIASL